MVNILISLIYAYIKTLCAQKVNEGSLDKQTTDKRIDKQQINEFMFS